MKHFYYNKKTRFAQGAAALIAGAVLLGGSVLGGHGHLISLAADTASQLPLKGEAIGALVIPAKLREEKPVHDKRMVTKAPDRVEIVEEESPSQPPAAQEEAAPEEVRTYLGSFKITGYDICPSCCGNTKGITASGTTATVGRTCAAPKDIPFGTRLWIEGIGERVVEDRGGAVNGKKIDVLCADHPACYAITGTYEVYIIEEAE